MPGGEIYEFGAYRLNASAPILLCDGEVVPLTPKAIGILVVLVRNHGELVSKDELMKAVWPDAFVEEGSLTQNISILRRVLGPAADGRPHIETIAKRGYRFAAHVRAVGQNGGEPAFAAGSTSAGPGDRSPRRSAWPRFGIAVALVLLASGGVALFLRFGAQGAPVRSVAVLPLANLSGDPGQDYFADGLTEALTGELAK